MSQSPTDESTIVDKAESSRAELVTDARKQKVEARSKVLVGKSWLQIIRHVLRERNNIVVVGTRHLCDIQGWFLGSTGIKLLRKCHCPVWIAQPLGGKDVSSILVAHDLWPAGDLAMELGSSTAILRNAQLHVLHTAKFPELDYMFPAKVSAKRKRANRDEAQAHIRAQLAATSLERAAHLHLEIEPPDVAVLNCISQYENRPRGDGKRSVEQALRASSLANTAERVLTRFPCSLLAVKPLGFESPSSLQQQEA